MDMDPNFFRFAIFVGFVFNAFKLDRPNNQCPEWHLHISGICIRVYLVDLNYTKVDTIDIWVF